MNPDFVTALAETLEFTGLVKPWAARGAGSGFFGIVTKYYLKLYPLPKAIHGSQYYYRLEDAPVIGTWLGELAPRISPSVELSQFILQAPPELQHVPATQNGWLCMVTATAFEDTPESARDALQLLEQTPITPLSQSFDTPLNFEQLFNASGALWPSGLRSRVEATYSNHSPGEMMQAVLHLLPRAPSNITVFLFTIFCGPDVPAKPKNMARSMCAKVYGGPWSMWRDASDDQVNGNWHHDMITTLRPFNIGYYIGETNTIERPDSARQAFTPANWQKLCDLRNKYDPDRVFFDYFDGFENK